MGLTRQGILITALALADRDGIEGLTIRRLAAELGVSPMAVYRHVANKQAILDGLLDVAISADLELPPAGEPRAWLRDAFVAIHRTLRVHPTILPLLGSAGSLGPGALGVAEAVFAALLELGLAPDEAVGAFHRLITMTIGSVTLESAAAGDPSEDLAERARQLGAMVQTLPLARYPSLVEHAPLLVRFVRPVTYADNLERLLGDL